MRAWNHNRYGNCATLLTAAILSAVAGPAAVAKTVYVDGVNGNNDWDGLCEEWDGGTCGPKKTIQHGITVAVDGDEVIVADAVYTGEGNTFIQYYGKAITLRSANGAAGCIIDCEGSEDPAIHIEGVISGTAILDGFTVINGGAC
ncbi:MAG: hypothetical protein JSV91_00080 [Phycisphaerales bacterium]|nr:MAG: hypothetical protein JSV91_00080 [Phycisphaerales bacterium]